MTTPTKEEKDKEIKADDKPEAVKESEGKNSWMQILPSEGDN